MDILLDCKMELQHFAAVITISNCFKHFVCIACNVPCIRVLVRLRYVSSFPDTFQPYLLLYCREVNNIGAESLLSCCHGEYALISIPHDVMSPRVLKDTARVVALCR